MASTVSTRSTAGDRACRAGLALVCALCLTAVCLAGPALAAPDGAALFATECAGCHGEKGDGKGDADPALLPPPRDLTRGKFKLGWGSAVAPTRELVEAILERGIAGTAMPSYRFLTAAERQALAAYVLELGKLDPAAKAEPPRVPEPPPQSGAVVERGAKAYLELGCQACHGTSGRGDGPAAAHLKDEWGSVDPPRDLVREPYRAGERPQDIFLRLKIGMPGTPMPGYADTADDATLWALTRYLQSIRKPDPAPSEPLALGRHVLEQRHCLACHRLGGKGGTVGPALDGVTRRLDPQWLRAFLANPRRKGKLDPATKRRMPQFELTATEIAALIAYLDSLPAAQ